MDRRRKAASAIAFIKLKGKMGQGKKKAPGITESACETEKGKQQVR